MGGREGGCCCDSELNGCYKHDLKNIVKAQVQQNRNLKQDIANGAKDAFDPDRVKSLVSAKLSMMKVCSEVTERWQCSCFTWELERRPCVARQWS